MQLPFTFARRPMPLAGTVACAAALTMAAGCGGDDVKTSGILTTSPAVPTSTTPTTPTTPDATTDTTPIGPSSDVPEKTTSKSDDQPAKSVPEPPAATAKEDRLKPVSKDDRLIVRSNAGRDPKWRVAGQLRDGNTFCVKVTSVGENPPAPDCQSGPQLALALLTDMGMGQGSADVAQITRSVRQNPSDTLISGAVTSDVKKVVINYQGTAYVAKVSSEAVRVPFKRSAVRTLAGISDADTAKLPGSLRLRVFGKSVPQINGNPAMSATLTRKHPVDGVLTFELQ